MENVIEKKQWNSIQGFFLLKRDRVKPSACPMGGGFNRTYRALNKARSIEPTMSHIATPLLSYTPPFHIPNRPDIQLSAIVRDLMWE